MSTDHVRYDLLVRDALRGVVRNVLADVAKNGLPGEHHFYISFDTRAPGVRMSGRLRAQYPEEMTIVLQHQFWDLTVSESGFEAGMSFGGVPERLQVPFDAVTGFVDPSVKFALEFQLEEQASPVAAAESAEPAPPASEGTPRTGRVASVPDTAKLDGPAPTADARAAKTSKKGKRALEPEPGNPASAEVVRLDRFRKK